MGTIARLSIDLNDLYLFAQVVENHGFTATSTLLGIPKSRLSRRISQLETKLDCRLLQRSSRHMSLTDAGQELYGYCLEMIAQAHAGEEALRNRLAEPSGIVRASFPVSIADILLAFLLPRFMSQYPKLRLIVQANNRNLDLIEEHIDVVVRGVGVALESSSLVQANLCSIRWAFVASPSYLVKTGPIHTPAMLSEVDALLYAPTHETEMVWQLLGPQEVRYEFPIHHLRLQADNLAILKQAALAGLGITSLPLYACNQEIKAGTLQIVLPDWRPKAGHLVVLFPSRRGLAPAVRALVDFLKIELPIFLEQHYAI